MYSIGKFALVSNLNKKTLRYYDEIDLFKPAYVDDNNQYRYYEENQIPEIKEIIKLRDIGVPIEQIKKIGNKHNISSLNNVYEKRLYEIEEALKQLKQQKNLIISYQKAENTEADIENLYCVKEGYFIEEGYVYYNTLNCEIDEINNYISKFYENIGQTTLISGHILKSNMDDDSKGISEIFAYISSNKEYNRVRFQSKEMCIKVECSKISQRENGYKALFDYAEKNTNIIHNVYEKYSINRGKMNIEIICSIE